MKCITLSDNLFLKVSGHRLNSEFMQQTFQNSKLSCLWFRRFLDTWNSHNITQTMFCVTMTSTKSINYSLLLIQNVYLMGGTKFSPVTTLIALLSPNHIYIERLGGSNLQYLILLCQRPKFFQIVWSMFRPIYKVKVAFAFDQLGGSFNCGTLPLWDLIKPCCYIYLMKSSY